MTLPADHPRIHLFGSSANEFGMRNADVDLCLIIDESAGTREEVVNELARMLRNSMNAN